LYDAGIGFLEQTGRPTGRRARGSSTDDYDGDSRAPGGSVELRRHEQGAGQEEEYTVPRRWSRIAITSLVAASGLTLGTAVLGAAARQTAPPQAAGAPQGAATSVGQAPVFRSGVELITVDVTVVDKSGNPIRSLGPEEFAVSVDGKPRRVVSANLVDYSARTSDRADDGSTIAPVATYSTNETAVAAAAPGRLVFLAIDQGSFRPAAARAAIDAARRFLDRLQPQDRVGLMTFPPPGPSLAPGTDREHVGRALGQIIGTAVALRSSPSARWVTLAESVDIEARDEFVTSQVIGRECRGLAGAALDMCSDQVRDEARIVAGTAEMGSNRTLASMQAMLTALARIPERKTLVLISAGLAASDRGHGALDLHGEIAALGRQAAAANANIYVLHVDNAFLEAYSANERSVSPSLDRDLAMLRGGLETMAAASGGALFTVVARADAAFERVLTETAAAYVLGVEPADGDRNGRPHAIKVAVNGRDAQVRSRREFVMVPTASAPETPEERLAAALKAQRLSVDLPLGISTHTLGQTDAGEVRVLLTARVGRGVTAPLETHIAYLLSEPSGRAIGTATESRRLPVARDATGGAASYLTAIGVRPGDYLLRFAVVDASGRLGSVEHWFSASLAEGDGIRMSDLLLLDPRASAEEDLAPIADGRMIARVIDGYLEIYPKRAGQPTPTVTFSLAERPDGPPLVQATAHVTRAQEGGNLIAEALLDTESLPTGNYVAVMRVTVQDRQIGKRIRPLRIEHGIAASAVAPLAPVASPPRVAYASAPGSSVPRAFSVGDALNAGAVRYSLGRLAQAQGAALADRAAVSASALERGEYDAALGALKELASDRLSVAFIRGVALLGQGQFDPAASEFRDAVRLDADFLPAAFYLGACYAAAGRDRDAISAWTTARATGADARVVYDVLADALLRVNEPARAMQTLAEARERWPDDASFVLRFAAAQGLHHYDVEAFDTLAGYLKSRPSDTDALGLAIRLLYEAHADGRALRSPDEDRELAATYGSAYKAAGGTAPIVEQWAAAASKR